MNTVTVVTDRIPNSAKTLIWDVFFASRNRGISLEAHYPWIDGDGVVCISLTGEDDDSKCLGCLVVKKSNVPNYGDVGMVGLVCVEPSLQGQGYSKILLGALKEFFESSALNSLVLWTSKNQVYSAFGFVEDEFENFYLVSKDGSFSKEINHGSVAFNIEEVKIGVPAFASSVVKVMTESCEIFLLKTDGAFTLASYAGSMENVFQILSEILPYGWFYNAKTSCPLLNLLRQEGFYVEERKSSSRMSLKKIEHDLLVIPEIPLLDRI